MKKGLLISLALILMVVAFLPAPAYAIDVREGKDIRTERDGKDGGDRDKGRDGDKDKDKLVPVSCILSLAVTDPGIIDLSGYPNVITTGEKTSGKLDCNLKAMDGDFSSVHSSRITVDPLTGSFNGSLKGTFTLRKNKGYVSTGKMSANISGYIIGFAPSPPFPPLTPIHRVVDNGKWEIDGKIDAKGTFAITLDGIVGLPASQGGLVGGGIMEGMAEKD